MMDVKVALSGSGFRLPAHVGALQAIKDAGLTISEMAGTSGGSIVAAIYACGMPLSDMRDLAMTFDWPSILTLDLWTGVRKGAYCSGNALLDFLYKETGNKCLGASPFPIKIIASDIRAEQEVCLSTMSDPLMPIALAARASASIPFVFVPVRYKNYMLVDGGVVNNIPVSHLSAGGMRLGVYLVSNDAPAVGVMGIEDIAGRTIDLMLASSEDAHSELTDATIVRVPTSYAGSLDTKMPLATRQRLYHDGYDSVSLALEKAMQQSR